MAKKAKKYFIATLNEFKKKAKELVKEADLDELVHELKASEASEINNGGLDKQLEYVFNQLGAKDAMLEVESLSHF
jgi:hypothetical protein